MLDLWRNDRGVVLYSVNPETMLAPVGTADPIMALWQNLTIYIADHFAHAPTQLQLNNASRSFRVLKARSRGPALMARPNRMPRGSGNTWRNTIVCGECDDTTSNAIVTETDIQVITS